MTELIEPISYSLIQFEDDKKTISYTDCFEISLLRFLHIIFYNSELKKIDFDKMKQFMNINSTYCQELLTFFEQNSEIKLDSDYYDNYDKDGYWIRSKWCQFLNKRYIFRYKKHDKYELCASMENFIMFFKIFFPRLYLEDHDITQKLKTIFKNVSSDDKIFSGEFSSEKIYNNNDNIHYTNKIIIFINSIEIYEWIIYQDYINDNGIMIDRQGGHSDIHFISKL